MSQILALASAVLANSDGSDGLVWLGLIFFTSGFVFYGYVFLRYRNADKRFKHEERTEHVKTDVKARDDFVRSMTGLRNSTMSGANSRAVRGNRNPISGLLDAAGETPAKGIVDQVMRFRPDK